MAMLMVTTATTIVATAARALAREIIIRDNLFYRCGGRWYFPGRQKHGTASQADKKQYDQNRGKSHHRVSESLFEINTIDH